MLSVIVVCYHVYDLEHLAFRVSTSIIYLFTHALNVKASFRERFSLSTLYYPYITPTRSRFVSHAPLVDILELSLLPYIPLRQYPFHVPTSSSWDHYFTPLDVRPDSLDVTVIIHCQEFMRWTAAKGQSETRSGRKLISLVAKLISP